MTAAAALEARVDMSRIFPMVPQTAIDLDGKVFRDWENHGKLRSLKEAMDVSSNIALFKVAKAMGPDALYRMTGRFGFNKASVQKKLVFELLCGEFGGKTSFVFPIPTGKENLQHRTIAQDLQRDFRSGACLEQAACQPIA